MTAEVDMVRSSLKELLFQHSSSSDLSCIDDVVVSYVCGVVEEIAAGCDEDIPVDAMEIKDVMSAYVPILENASENEMEMWVRQMVKKAIENKNKQKTDKDISINSFVSCFVAPTCKQRTSSTTSETSERSHKLSENSDSSEEMSKLTCGKDEDQYGEAMSMILEMFPGTCSLEAQHCLSSCGGLLEDATILFLERQEQGLSINSITKIIPRSQKCDEKTIRNSIVNRYGFIDNEDDRKEHRPVAPKWEGKKMVRYRDNKVVSLKGERYTEIRKEESEESKKSCVNLKPGKQYRFH